MASTTKPSTALARLQSLPKSTVITKAANATRALSSLRREVQASKVPNALAGGGFSLVGATVGGAVRGWRDEVAGIPLDAGLGLVTGGIGIGLGRPSLIFAGSGMIGGFLSNFAEDKVAGWLEGRSEDTDEDTEE